MSVAKGPLFRAVTSLRATLLAAAPATLLAGTALTIGLPGHALAQTPAAAPTQTAPAGTSGINEAAPGTGNAAEEPASGPGILIPGTGITVTSTAAVSNDYLFRGISQTRNNWALQGTVDIAHESGVYVGAFITNAKFLGVPYNDTRQEVDALGGYRFSLGPVNLDIGYVGYFYPGQEKPEGTQLNSYMEVMAKATYTIDIVKLSAALAYSPNFFGRSGTGWYVEGGVDVTLPFEITAFGRLGHQWIQNNPRFGTPDYLWYGVGIQREILLGFTAAVGWYGTNISKRDCAPLVDRADSGQRICEGRVLFTVSKTF
jgi:uncharacterized protein (TIGR02001 family)